MTILSDDIRLPLIWYKPHGSSSRNCPALCCIEFSQDGNGRQERVTCDIGLESKGSQKGWSKLPQIAIAGSQKIKVTIVERADYLGILLDRMLEGFWWNRLIDGRAQHGITNRRVENEPSECPEKMQLLIRRPCNRGAKGLQVVSGTGIRVSKAMVKHVYGLVGEVIQRLSHKDQEDGITAFSGHTLQGLVGRFAGKLSQKLLA